MQKKVSMSRSKIIMHHIHPWSEHDLTYDLVANISIHPIQIK